MLHVCHHTPIITQDFKNTVNQNSSLLAAKQIDFESGTDLIAINRVIASVAKRPTLNAIFSSQYRTLLDKSMTKYDKRGVKYWWWDTLRCCYTVVIFYTRFLL